MADLAAILEGFEGKEIRSIKSKIVFHADTVACQYSIRTTSGSYIRGSLSADSLAGLIRSARDNGVLDITSGEENDEVSDDNGDDGATGDVAPIPPATTTTAPHREAKLLPPDVVCAKNRLSEALMIGRIAGVRYQLERRTGPPHMPKFTSTCYCTLPDGRELVAHGTSGKLRDAEKLAAHTICREIGLR